MFRGTDVEPLQLISSYGVSISEENYPKKNVNEWTDNGHDLVAGESLQEGHG